MLPWNGGDRHSSSSAGSQSRGSSQGLRRHEREQRRDQDHRHEKQVGQDSGEGSSQGYRLASYITEQEFHERRDQEMECLCMQVRELELEVQRRRRRRNCDESPDNFGNMGERESRGESSHQSGSHQSRERLSEVIGQCSDSPHRHGHHSIAMDAMSRALQRAAQLPYSDEIERA